MTMRSNWLRKIIQISALTMLLGFATYRSAFWAPTPIVNSPAADVVTLD